MDIRRPTTARDGPESKGLTARQQRALAALLEAPTVREAARLAGIGERTLKTYRADPAFREAYKAALHDSLSDALRLSRASMTSALTTLKEVMENKGENAQARIQAARATLEYGLRLTEAMDFESRLTELEQAERGRN